MNYKIIFCSILIVLQFQVNAQKVWNIDDCLNYALEQNIDLQKGRISTEESKINIKQAKAQWQPTLSFSTSHSLNNSPWVPEGKDHTSYNGNYGLGAGWTVFNGFKRKYAIKQQEVQGEISKISEDEIIENLKISVLSYYIQVLYAEENLKVKTSSLEVAKAQDERSSQLYEAGAISKSDYSQIKAQYVNEYHQYVEAKNNLTEAKLNLKLLLKLNADEEMEVLVPVISEESITKSLPNKTEIYETVLSTRPEIQAAKLNEEISELKIKAAKSGYYPSINLSAGVSTGHNSISDLNFGDQMKQNFGENVGISLNYSILDNRNRKSEVEKAKLEKKLVYLQTDKIKDDMRKLIESAYNDAIAAQLSYVASISSEEAAQASYDLTKEKYELGIKNPYEMLNERNSLLNAQEQTLQAKYTAILNIQILNVYQGLPIVME